MNRNAGKIIPQDAGKIFKAIEQVIEVSNLKRQPKREILGFLDKHLVHFDGRKINPVTVRESIRHYFRMDLRWNTESKYADMNADNAAKGRWVRLVQRELKP